MTDGAGSSGFLELPSELTRCENALFHVIPVPLERSVSWGRGTARGPQAILQASGQVEDFDGYSVPAEAGICTHEFIPCDGGRPTQDILDDAAREAGRIIGDGTIPVILGGEHTVALGGVQAALAACPGVGIVYFDAHSDLRDEYEDNPLSHACTGRRIYDMGAPLFQIGRRSWCAEEDSFVRQSSIGRLDGIDIHRNGVPDTVLPSEFPDEIYITFDVDALDPSIMPATGTPEPGGILWYDALQLLERVTGGRTVIGFDIVELAPREGMHAADFTAARLAYQIMGFITRGKEKRAQT